MSHLERLEREAGVPGLVDILHQRLSSSDLQSLLLEVYRRKSRDLKPSQVLRRYQDSRFSRPSALCPRSLTAVRTLVLEALRGQFQPIQLSPVSPLGTCSAVATCDQNKIVSTIRNLEVAADPTNALALEATVRRKGQDEVHLAAVQRVVRAQDFGQAQEAYAHFELFALLSSGRKGKGFMVRHLQTVIDFLISFPGELGNISLHLTPLDHRGGAAIQQATEELEALFPTCRIALDTERGTGRGYYQKLCYKIYADGVELGDGGYTDWTARLANDRKEQCMISGLGLDRLGLRLGAEGSEEDC